MEVFPYTFLVSLMINECLFSKEQMQVERQTEREEEEERERKRGREGERKKERTSFADQIDC